MAPFRLESTKDGLRLIAEDDRVITEVDVDLGFDDAIEQWKAGLAAPATPASPTDLVVWDPHVRAVLALAKALPADWRICEEEPAAIGPEPDRTALPPVEAAPAPIAPPPADLAVTTPTPARVAVEPEPPRPALIPLRVLVKELRDKARFGASPRDLEGLASQVARHPEAGDDGRNQAEQAIAQGAAIRGALERVDRLAKAKGPDSDEVRTAIEDGCTELGWWPVFRERAAEKVEIVRRQRQRAQSSVGHVCEVHPTVVDHSIQSLDPASDWTLLIDEGGNIPSAADEPPLRGPVGRFVGLLVPRGAPLPELRRGWHAVGCGDVAEIDHVVQTVLDEHVGVLGLQLPALPPSKGDPWVTGVLEVIHWVCRLLPIQGRTRVRVLVEQRGEFNRDVSWRSLAAEVQRHLTELDPRRYRHLALDVRIVTKHESPWNGYVDALAFTWTSPTPASNDRLRKSGLLHHCLHTGDAGELRRAWDAVGAGRPLDPEAWRRVLGLAAQAQPGSIPERIAARVRSECRRDPERWEALLVGARRHLESKAVHLPSLGHEIEFLEECAPAGHDLLPALRLAWMTARLERANHLGATDASAEAALEELAGRLFDEAPDLVCQADLDRAVLATNRFDFQAATRALARWNDVPPAVPGLCHWARVRSSLGQHAAFLDRPAEALALFDEALEAFERMSDPVQADGERAQTSTYRAITLMDAGGPQADARKAIEALTNLGRRDLRELAASSEPAQKYAHHLLVRFLSSHGTEDERSAYLGARADWGVDEGHPWPLICFYRSRMLRAVGIQDEADDWLTRAVDLALAGDQGPTVVFIGLVIAVSGWMEGGPNLGNRFDTQALQKALPLAPWGVVEDATSRRWTGGPDAFWRAALPFAFR